jgi:SnoaL-like protein
MPWIPELFSAPVLQQVLDERRHERLSSVPYFEGYLAGEPDALVESFAGEPVLHDPVRGRVRGAQAFRTFAIRMGDWLAERNASVEHLSHVVLDRCGFEEVVLQLDGADGRVTVPLAIVAERHPDGQIEEIRVYHSNRPVTGRHTQRPPLMQLDPDVRCPDVVADFERALAAGDVDAVVATFEPDGYARAPGSDDEIHGGPDDLRAFYGRQFSAGGGVEHELCTYVGDERTGALEYNVVRWGSAELLPQAGIAIFVQGASGKLAAVRAYDDVEPPYDAAAVPYVSG